MSRFDLDGAAARDRAHAAAASLLLLLDAIAPSLRRAFTPLAVLATLAAACGGLVRHARGHAARPTPAATFNGLLETSRAHRSPSRW